MADSKPSPDRLGTGCSAMVRGVSHRTLALTETVEWHLAEEVPTALVYNGRSFAVMLASPADLEDFGLGFSLAEGVVETAGEVDDITVRRLEAGFAVRMTIPNIRAAALIGRGRAMEGRSGCGICGIETLEGLRRPARKVRAPDVAPAAIARAFDQLHAHQPMRARNFSVHGAAWCDRQGQVLLSREDVGRHTALDKLIGAMSQAGMDKGDGFVVMSSRCGFELVQKAANVGIGLLASVSAPTTMALSMAREAGMSLAVSSGGGAVVMLE